MSSVDHESEKYEDISENWRSADMDEELEFEESRLGHYEKVDGVFEHFTDSEAEEPEPEKSVGEEPSPAVSTAETIANSQNTSQPVSSKQNKGNEIAVGFEVDYASMRNCFSDSVKAA